MKYPKYGEWCKKNIIETIKKQKIHDSKKYLNEFILIQRATYTQVVYMIMKYVTFYGLSMEMIQMIYQNHYFRQYNMDLQRNISR